MRCKACDQLLTDRESVRRVTSTNEFLDLCNECYNTIMEDVPTIERSDNDLIEKEENYDPGNKLYSI